MIGNELGRLRNNVLRRRMFTTPQQRAALSRSPVGINASGPELIKATSTQPDLLNRMSLVTPVAASTLNSTATANQRPINPNPSRPNIPPVVSGQGFNRGEFEGVGPQEDRGLQPPVTTNLDDVPPSFEQPKKKKKKKEEKKPSSKGAMDEILDKISGMRGDENADKKTRKEKFQEAKDFLIEAGLTDAKDVRTDRDFLLMLGGLKFAAGSGTGSTSQDAIAALSSVLGTFAGGKKDEREQEQKLRMAAAQRVLAQEDTDKATAAARDLALDKATIQALTKKVELEQDPKLIREVQAIMAETGKSFEDSLILANQSTKKIPGAEVQAAQALMKKGIPEATARLLARDTELVSKILEGEITSEQLTKLLNDLAGSQQSSSNAGGNAGGNTGGNTGTSGNIPLTGNEDQTS